MAFNIAIIPARGGSKRLPGKNIKPLAGVPLICWTINAALKSELFDKVLVSTDSRTIADIAIAAGAEVPYLRPDELSGDMATTSDVINHMVNWVEEHHEKVTCITLLQPTSPLRDAQNIKEAWHLYNKKNATAVISVCAVEHPVQYCNRLGNDLSMNGFIKDVAKKRSQDLEPYYRLNGAIYIFDRQYAEDLSAIYAQNSYAYIMDKRKSVDIDDEYDFTMAECLIDK